MARYASSWFVDKALDVLDTRSQDMFITGIVNGRRIASNIVSFGNRLRLLSVEMSNFAPIIAKYNVIPCTLFQIASQKKVVLREYEAQKKLGRHLYDFVARSDGLIVPSGDMFDKPNGLYLHSAGDILDNKGGRFKVVVVPEDTPIPPELVLCQGLTDLYSLQTSEPVAPDLLNARLTKFFKGMERITKEQYFERYLVTGGKI